ncbi:hypothetical protein NMY22_g14756 [Coprinellus aureogranulatus]|nr:hypothetical protein NMY22_g14756 [Coprinellus aureogranulatus]
MAPTAPKSPKQRFDSPSARSRRSNGRMDLKGSNYSFRSQPAISAKTAHGLSKPLSCPSTPTNVDKGSRLSQPLPRCESPSRHFYDPSYKQSSIYQNHRRPLASGNRCIAEGELGRPPSASGQLLSYPSPSPSDPSVYPPLDPSQSHYQGHSHAYGRASPPSMAVGWVTASRSPSTSPNAGASSPSTFKGIQDELSCYPSPATSDYETALSDPSPSSSLHSPASPLEDVYGNALIGSPTKAGCPRNALTSRRLLNPCATSFKPCKLEAGISTHTARSRSAWRDHYRPLPLRRRPASHRLRFPPLAPQSHFPGAGMALALRPPALPLALPSAGPLPFPALRYTSRECVAYGTHALPFPRMGVSKPRAEKAVNDRLARTPELYLLALAQFAISADTEVMRSFSLVLLRRLLFRSSPSSTIPSSSSPFTSSAPRLTLYDHLSSGTLTTLERLLLYSLSHEGNQGVRRKSVDTVCDVCKQGMVRGRPWHALQAQVFTMANQPQAGLRESAYRVFAGCPNLVMDLQTDAVLQVFQRGLKDGESVEVRYAALLAAVAYLTACEPGQLAQSLSLMYPVLETVHFLSQNLLQPPLHPSSSTEKPSSNTVHLTQFLTALTPLCSTNPALFQPHLSALLSFMPQLILPAVDCGPTPTVSRPFPTSRSASQSSTGGGAFVFPLPGDAPSSLSSSPSSSHSNGNGNNDEDTSEEDALEQEEKDERSALRLAALEFMVSLSEARPGMVKRVQGWVEVLVRACLEGMGELDEDEAGVRVREWLKEDPSLASDTDEGPAMYEQSIDRLACALGGKAVLPPAFQYIPGMLASYDWRSRHAGLMAIASIAEGTGRVMQNELGKIVDLVIPMFKDAHPRVRYAACQCIGQLCTDLEEVIQEQFHEQLFPVLVQALEDPEPRVHAHAAAALINFCEGVERETLLPYLDPIVERLLKLLNPGGDQASVMRYVQEQAITTLAMVADASEGGFANYYSTIMPLLLSVLQNADGREYQKLRTKAMECAGLIAIAVGKEVFRPDSSALIEQLIRIQTDV